MVLKIFSVRISKQRQFCGQSKTNEIRLNRHVRPLELHSKHPSLSCYENRKVFNQNHIQLINSCLSRVDTIINVFHMHKPTRWSFGNPTIRMCAVVVVTLGTPERTIMYRCEYRNRWGMRDSENTLKNVVGCVCGISVSETKSLIFLEAMVLYAYVHHGIWAHFPNSSLRWIFLDPRRTFPGSTLEKYPKPLQKNGRKISVKSDSDWHLMEYDSCSWQ